MTTPIDRPPDSSPAGPYDSSPGVPPDSSPAGPYDSSPGVPHDSSPAGPYDSSPGVPHDSSPGVPHDVVEPDDGQRIAPLRGAGVTIDGRRVLQVIVAIVLVTLAVLAIVFTVTGIQKNNQIDELHDKGVPVTVVVTGCLGLLGGSGSNGAGDSCQGTYTLRGHTYHERLPGTAFHRPGSTIPAVAVPGDPALVSPISIEQGERSSSGVFVLPAVLLVVFVLGLAVVVWRRRARDSDSTRPDSGSPLQDRETPEDAQRGGV